MTWIVLVVLVLVQAVAGAFWWRLVRRRAISWVEVGGMGLALGTALSVLAGCLGFLLPIGSFARTWVWVLPALAAGALWVARRASGRLLAAASRPARAETVAVSIGLVVGLITLVGNLAKYPLSWVGEWGGYHQDMVFFEALATGTSVFSPDDSIFMSGADIRYHWLSYAWVGQLTEAAGAGPFMVLTRILPAVAIVGSVLICVAWTRQLTRQPWAPTVAALLLVSGGYVGAIYGAILNFDSPSQSLTTMWLLALVVGLLFGLRGGSRWGWFLVVLVLGVAVAGGKFSSIIVAAGGFGLVAILGVVTRAPWWRRGLLLAVSGGMATVAAYLLFVSGSAQAGGIGLWSLLDRASSVQGLNPQTTDRGIMVGTALLILAMTARWAGLVWLGVDRHTRWRPETVMGLGMAVVGVLTIALVSGGFNDMWFALAASAPLAALSAAGLGNAAGALARGAPPGEGSRLPRALAWSVLLGGAASVLVALVWGTGAYSVGGWRWAAPIVGLGAALLIGLVMSGARQGASVDGMDPGGGDLPRSRRFVVLVIAASIAMAVFGRPLYLVVEQVMAPAAEPHDSATFAPVVAFVDSIDREGLTAMSSDQLAAGGWLNSTAARDDIVATNLTYSPLVPAVTGLRTWVSGIHYQAPYGRPGSVDELLARERASWDFVEAPRAETAGPLCEAGADWVWVDPRRTAVRDWSPWASIAWEASDVIVLRVEASACPVTQAASVGES